MRKLFSYPAGQTRQLLLLACAMFVGGLSRSALGPLQETMRVALDLKDTQMALIQGPVIGIPIALAAIPFGVVIDRTSRAKLVVGLCVLCLIGTVLTACASDFVVLLIARGLAGLAGLEVPAVVMSMLADMYPAELRGRVTTVGWIGQVAGSSFAFALGGFLVAAVQVHWRADRAEDWRLAMLGLSVPIAVIATLTLYADEPVRTEIVTRNPSLPQLMHELRHLWPVLFPLAAGGILIETSIGSVVVWSAPMLARRFALPVDQIGSLMAIVMLVSGIVGPIVGGTLADRSQSIAGPRRTIGAAQVLSLIAAPLSLFALARTAGFAVFLLTTSFTLMLSVATIQITVITVLVPNELRGLCVTVMLAAEQLASLAVAPLVVSLLSGLMGGLQMIGWALSIFCVGTVLGSVATFARTRTVLRTIPVRTAQEA